MSIGASFLQFLSDINSSREIHYILIRTGIIYIYAIFLLRHTVRHQLQTALDFVLIFTIGGILGGAIFGASLVAMFLSSLLLMLIHKGLALLSFHSRFWGRLMKGQPHILYDKGRFDRKMLCRLQVTKDDIMAECRKQLQKASLVSVRQIRMERTGHISFIRKK